MKHTITLAALVALPVAAHADDRLDEARALPWKPATKVHLADSKARLNLPGFEVVLGRDARRMREIADGRSDANEEAEAVSTANGDSVIYQWTGDGFVSESDWADVDPDGLLKQIEASDVELNKARQAPGLPTLTTTGWRQRPTFNGDAHSVTWAIERGRGQRRLARGE
jgi:uncharacterized membrane-anchored protein